MEVFERVEALQNYLSRRKSDGLIVGFVPTMGALHRGHATLIETARSQCEEVVVSIFVNPNQFNNPNDLARYPRTPEKDFDLCRKAGATSLFVPSVQEVYPEPDKRVFSFGPLEKVMEGEFRPGHFNGVAQVVSRLFEMVKPHKAFFGEKDFQQLAIVRRMVEMLSINVDIVACPTVREPDGLAMSSRNMLLSAEQRQAAPLIAKTLHEARNKKDSFNVNNTLAWVVSTINSNPLLRVEYFQIVDASNLQPIQGWDEAKRIVGCIAVNVGEVRLIDNVSF